jgi:Mn2+/Fe2+ NRAMP family transporter
VNPGQRESLADVLIVIGAAALFLSLFLTWSHQFSVAFLTRTGAAAQLHDLPPSPTAWQVYSVVDVLLALLAAALLYVALLGRRTARVLTLLAVVLALVFTVHALAVPPTSGVNIANATGTGFAPNSPTAGGGEIVAIAALGLAIAGLALSFSAD